jgi:hypothetical protein
MKKLIVVLHCLEMLALAAWVGGLITIIAAVIPAVFNTVGMESGGRMLTRTFQGYDRIVLSAAGLIVIGMLTRAIAGGPWRAQVGIAELIVFGTMLVIAAYLALAWNPHMLILQERAFTAQDPVVRQMALQDFFVGHQVARALYLLNFGFGIALICMKVSKWAR